MRRLALRLVVGIMAVQLGMAQPVLGPSTMVAFAEASSPAQAAERKARLDALFAALAAAGGDAEAREVVAEIWQTWTSSGRDDVDLLMQQAGAGMYGRKFGMASMLLDEVVELAPEFPEGWNRRATLRFMMGDYAGSQADIDKVLALEPRHFGALAGRAMIYMKGEQWPEALAAYRKALEANPFLADRHQMLPLLERKVAEGRL